MSQQAVSTFSTEDELHAALTLVLRAVNKSLNGGDVSQYMAKAHGYIVSNTNLSLMINDIDFVTAMYCCNPGGGQFCRCPG